MQIRLHSAVWANFFNFAFVGAGALTAATATQTALQYVGYAALIVGVLFLVAGVHINRRPWWKRRPRAEDHAVISQPDGGDTYAQESARLGAIARARQDHDKSQSMVGYDWRSLTRGWPQVIADGARSVALGGDNTGTINTGDILENRPFKLTPDFLEESLRRIDLSRPIVLRTVRDQNLGAEFERFLKANGANVVERKTPGGYNSDITVERPLNIRDRGDHTEVTLDPS